MVVIIDDSLERNDGLIQYPRLLGLCRVCFCLVYDLSHGRQATPLYLVLDIVSTFMQSLISSTLYIALKPSNRY